MRRRPSPDELRDRLGSEPGPFVIIAKGHSGTRFLSEAFMRNGIFMGADLNGPFDSMSWLHRYAMPLMNSRWFPRWEGYGSDEELTRFCDERLAATLPPYVGDWEPDGPWGWKGSTLFVMPVVTAQFPGARLVHLIRDGRDVALSEDGTLNLPFHYRIRSGTARATIRRAVESVVDRRRRDDYRKKVVFGRSDIDEWDGAPLDRRRVHAHRFELQMLSWINNVTTARRYGAAMGDAYCEIRYEELCNDPVGVGRRIFDFLGVEMRPETAEFLAGRASTSSIGKWRSLQLDEASTRDFERAMEVGAPLLAELGYVDPPADRTSATTPS